MKRMMAKTLLFIILCFVIVTACTLCLSKPAEPSKSNVDIYSEEDEESIKKLLSTYPRNLNPENVAADGCFVLLHGVVVGDSQKTWDTFYSNVKNKNDAAILIVYYTVEGDPILNYVSFVNGSFYSVRDSSRDSWGGPPLYSVGSYKFLHVFKTWGVTRVILSDIDYKKWKDYENDTTKNHEKSLRLFSTSGI